MISLTQLYEPAWNQMMYSISYTAAEGYRYLRSAECFVSWGVLCTLMASIFSFIVHSFLTSFYIIFFYLTLYFSFLPFLFILFLLFYLFLHLIVFNSISRTCFLLVPFISLSLLILHYPVFSFLVLHIYSCWCKEKNRNMSFPCNNPYWKHTRNMLLLLVFSLICSLDLLTLSKSFCTPNLTVFLFYLFLKSK